MPSICSDQSEHHIRDIFMRFLSLNKEKRRHWGSRLSGWDIVFSETLAVRSSLQGRADIPTVPGKETPLPHNCWLRSSFKSVSWNNNKIFIKLCIWTMSGQSQLPTTCFLNFSCYFFLEVTQLLREVVPLYLITYGHVRSPSRSALYPLMFLKRLSWMSLGKRLRHRQWVVNGDYPKQYLGMSPCHLQGRVLQTVLSHLLDTFSLLEINRFHSHRMELKRCRDLEMKQQLPRESPWAFTPVAHKLLTLDVQIPESQLLALISLLKDEGGSFEVDWGRFTREPARAPSHPACVINGSVTSVTINTRQKLYMLFLTSKVMPVTLPISSDWSKEKRR